MYILTLYIKYICILYIKYIYTKYKDVYYNSKSYGRIDFRMTVIKTKLFLLTMIIVLDIL
jgi:hypothetical protein